MGTRLTVKQNNEQGEIQNGKEYVTNTGDSTRPLLQIILTKWHYPNCSLYLLEKDPKKI